MATTIEMIIFIVFSPAPGREGPSLGKFCISGCFSSLSRYQWCCHCHHHYHQNGSVQPVIACGTMLSVIQAGMVVAGQMCVIKTHSSPEQSTVTTPCRKEDENNETYEDFTACTLGQQTITWGLLVCLSTTSKCDYVPGMVLITLYVSCIILATDLRGQGHDCSQPT